MENVEEQLGGLRLLLKDDIAVIDDGVNDNDQTVSPAG